MISEALSGITLLLIIFGPAAVVIYRDSRRLR